MYNRIIESLRKITKVFSITLLLIFVFLLTNLIIILIIDMSKEFERKIVYQNIEQKYTNIMKDDFETNKEAFYAVKNYFEKNHSRLKSFLGEKDGFVRGDFCLFKNRLAIYNNKANTSDEAKVIDSTMRKSMNMSEKEYEAFDKIINELEYQSVQFTYGYYDNGNYYIKFVKKQYTIVTDKILADDIYMWGDASICYNHPMFYSSYDYPYEILDETDINKWSVYFDQHFGV